MTNPLTRRQREVLILAANGNSNAAIARWRGITPNYVGEILTAAYRALGVSDRAQAVAVALKLGEFGVDDIELPVDYAKATLSVSVLPGPRPGTACESGRHVHHPGESCAEVDVSCAAVTARLDAALQSLDADPCAGFPDECPNLVEVQARSRYHGGGIRCGCREAS